MNTLDIKELSADIKDSRVLRVYFAAPITKKDRRDLAEAVNLLREKRGELRA